MGTLITQETPVSEEVLNAIAHMPTKSLPALVSDGFGQKAQRCGLHAGCCLSRAEKL